MRHKREDSKIRQRILIYFIILFAGSAFNDFATAEDLYDPVGIYLTWVDDPTTTMTIDWHTTLDDDDREPLIQYKKVGDHQWIEIRDGSAHKFPNSDRTIHRIKLWGLEPGTEYRFRFGEDSRAYKFRTMPYNIENQSLSFATGGDIRHQEEWMLNTNRAVMQYDLDFIVWGGDLAYTNADPGRKYRWFELFTGIKETLVYEDGRILPVIVTIGNHEIFNPARVMRGSHPHDEHTEEEALKYMRQHNLWPRKATYFYELFAFPGNPAYDVLDFGDYMSLIALDTNHGSRVVGPQTGWLEAVLAERVDRPHIFPVYHVPAYPSHRSYDGTTATQIRENWVPLFEEYGVRVAFENHDHTYKRTHPIRAGEISEEDGIVYIGDGAWGVRTRDGDSKDEWYINRFESVRHGIIVTLDNETQEYIMVDEHGEVFDTYTNHP